MATESGSECVVNLSLVSGGSRILERLVHGSTKRRKVYWSRPLSVEGPPTFNYLRTLSSEQDKPSQLASCERIDYPIPRMPNARSS